MDKIEMFVNKVGIHLDIVVVHILGSVDTVAAYKFQDQMNKLIKSGVYKYIIDLEKLDYISSAGIGVFPAVESELQKNNGGIIFVNVSGRILKLFNMIGLTTLFKVKDTLEQAVEEFEH
jgi:anti-sigma B factor antagonist